MKTTNLILYWAARIIASLILLQTLFFKFTAADESVEIFTRVGMEPWGRIGVGVLELVAAVFMLISATAWIGAGLALGLMAGAIVMHLTILGISVQQDGGYLFFLSVVVSVCSVIILLVNKQKIVQMVRSFSG